MKVTLTDKEVISACLAYIDAKVKVPPYSVIECSNDYRAQSLEFDIKPIVPAAKGGDDEA